MTDSTETLLHQLNYFFNELVLFRIQDVGITLNHFAVAFVSVLISLLLSRILRSMLQKRILKRMNLDPGLEFTFLRFTHFTVLGVGVYVGLSSLNIPLGALVGLFALLGVGIGFGLQNITSNFISGIILLLERPVKVGDRIELDDIWGDVKRINLRTTVVETPDDISVIVPNSKLLENNLINNSYGNRKIRLHLPVGVAYGSDVDRVTRLLQEAAKDVTEIIPEMPVKVWFLEFGDSSLNFELLVWIHRAEEKYATVDKLNRKIDALFRSNGVEIPFPQRDLHLRSSDPTVRITSTNE